MVAEEFGEQHAPPNMVMAFKQLRVLWRTAYSLNLEHRFTERTPT